MINVPIILILYKNRWGYLGWRDVRGWAERKWCRPPPPQYANVKNMSKYHKRCKVILMICLQIWPEMIFLCFVPECNDYNTVTHSHSFTIMKKFSSKHCFTKLSTQTSFNSFPKVPKESTKIVMCLGNMIKFA